MCMVYAMAEPLHISVPYASDDYTMFKLAIDQGIDSHLEGFTKSTFKLESGSFGARLEIDLDRDEIPTMVRRLREQYSDIADSWADDIEQGVNDE